MYTDMRLFVRLCPDPLGNLTALHRPSLIGERRKDLGKAESERRGRKRDGDKMEGKKEGEV